MKKNLGVRGFTLVELLIAMAVIAIIAAVAVITLNPAQILQQSRDGRRISDIDAADILLSLAQGKVPLGNTSTVYISLPDPTISGAATSTCSSLGLIPLPTSTAYHCVSPENLRKVDGTGWMPVDFTQLAGGSPFGSLPVDPLNRTSTGSYYAYATDGTNYELTANLDSTKYAAREIDDGGTIPFLYETGSSLALIKEDYGCASGGPCIWVGDKAAGRVQKFDWKGNYISHVSEGLSPESIKGIAVNINGDLLVTHATSVRRFSSNGDFLSQFGSAGSGDGQFSSTGLSAYGITTDSAGNIYVTDAYNDRIQKFSPDGIYISQFGAFGSGNGQFDTPQGIVLNAAQEVYVMDACNQRIQKLDANYNYLTQFGAWTGGCGYADGVRGIAIDADSNIYLTNLEVDADTVSKFSQDGTPVSFPDLSSYLDGQYGIAVDANGDIYIADGYAYGFNRFDASGNHVWFSGGYGTGNGQFDSGSSENPGYIAVR